MSTYRHPELVKMWVWRVFFVFLNIQSIPFSPLWRKNQNIHTNTRIYVHTCASPRLQPATVCHIHRRNEWRLSWQHIIKTWFSPVLGFLEWERGSIQPASLEARGSTSKTQYPDQKCNPQTHGLTLFFFYFCSASFLHTGEDISFSTLSFKTTRCSGQLFTLTIRDFSTLTAELPSQLGFQACAATQSREWRWDYTSPNFVFLPATSECQVKLLKGCICSGIPAHKLW